MAGHVHPFGVAAPRLRVVAYVHHAATACVDDLRQRHFRAERVVGGHEGCAPRDEGGRHELEVSLVLGVPVPAVEEHQDGGAGPGGKHVVALGGTAPVGDIRDRREALPRRGALPGPALEVVVISLDSVAMGVEPFQLATAVAAVDGVVANHGECSPGICSFVLGLFMTPSLSDAWISTVVTACP